MNHPARGTKALTLLTGLLAGAWLTAAWNGLPLFPAMELPAAAASLVADPAADRISNDVERLKAKATDQAHVMVSVAYHFNNLWFAGQHGNWPLAQFYLNETRSHLRWAVRVIPVRKDNAGREVRLQSILEAVENSPLKQLEQAIHAEDRGAFVDAYKFMLESCYACHKASDKPYIRPRIPTQPADATIDFEPLPAAETQPPRFQVPGESIRNPATSNR